MKHDSQSMNHTEKDGKKIKHHSHNEVHVESHIEMETSSETDGHLRELEDDIKRVQAEFINYKRRSLEERGELLNYGKSEAVMLLLPLLDNIDRALGYMPADLAENDWVKGVSQIAKQALEVLSRLGVKKIATVGQAFDANLHEAVVMEDGEGDQEVVTEELQAGYKMGERVLRHAMVKVGRK